MGWKDLFVVPEDEEEATPEVNSAPAAPKPKKIVVNTASGSSNDSEFAKQLRESLQAHASEGYGYLTFKQTCDELKDVLPDETVRLKSAFVTAKAMKANKQSLIKTAKDCLSTLEAERAEFDEAMEATVAQQVDGQINRIPQIDESIQQCLSDIQEIESRMDSLRKEKVAITESVEDSREKIESAKRSFTSAYNTIVAEVNSDIDKITSNL